MRPSFPQRLTIDPVEKVSTSGQKTGRPLVTFQLQDFYISYWRHYLTLRLAIEKKYPTIEIRQEEGSYNTEFRIYIRMLNLHKPTGSMPKGIDEKLDKLLFSRLREGFLPTREEVLSTIELHVHDDRKVKPPDRELGKVKCAFIYSSPEHIYIFKRLVNQTTNQLIGQVNFDSQIVPVPDVLEIWINGILIYSLWSCSEPPILHDIIYELHKAAECQPFNAMPRLR